MQIAPAASQCLQRLAAKLLEVCKNPTQPGFNHYMFESTAALIRCSAASDPTMVPALEQQLFPAFNVVLQEDVQVSCHPTPPLMSCCLHENLHAIHSAHAPALMDILIMDGQCAFQVTWLRWHSQLLGESRMMLPHNKGKREGGEGVILSRVQHAPRSRAM